MRGVIKRAQVLAHPVVIVQGFGLKVLVRALFSSARETFLEIVTRCAEEEAHLGMAEVGLVGSVGRFVGFECRIRDVYRELARQLSGSAEAAQFFATLGDHEEGHAVFLSRVRREIRRGRLWKQSRSLHLADLELFENRIEAWEDEVRPGVSLPRALELVEAIEGSELNVVFDTLSASVDMRSRARFERFFVLTRRHLAYCAERIRALRTRHGIAAAGGAEDPGRTRMAETCLDCHGSGEVKCLWCSGKGTMPCPSCGGAGEGSRAPCGSCGGAGVAKCDDCLGNGVKACPRCHGSGKW